MANTRLFLTFTENFQTVFQKLIFHKLAYSPKPFSQDFLWIFKFSENCPKTHKEFPKKYLLTSFIKSILPNFITVRSFQRI